MRPRHAYVHVPFCARRCSYCDFSIAVRRTVPVDEYLSALAAELRTRYPVGDGPAWMLDTLYLGGGTPSLLGERGVPRLVELVREHATLEAGAEVTLEANPDDVTDAAAAAWRRAGVTRVSLGVQSFDSEVLAWMHRSHTADRIVPAVDALRASGFDDLSLDLIFALPSVLGRDWDDDLDRALALDPTHVSLYGLTIEPRTPLGRWQSRGDAVEAPEERYAAEFLAAHERMAAVGLDHYEVSNFARPGRRARHNAAYWTGAAYAGLGPAAHEFDGCTRRWNVGPYAAWAALAAAGADPIEESEALTQENRVVETVYLGLRTSEGLPLLPGEDALVAPWVRSGWGSITADGRFAPTPEGWLRMDALAQSLTLSRSRS